MKIGWIALLAAAAMLTPGEGRAVAPDAAPIAPIASLGADWPREKTATPTVEEWKAAAPIALSRHGRRAIGCKALATREWLKIRCPLVASAIASVGGEGEVYFWRPPTSPTSPFPDVGCEVMFPVRPGDARVIQVWGFADAYEGFGGITPMLVISEQWPDVDAAPTVTAG